MKLAIHGYGKMGKTIERVARDAGHDVVCILDVDRNDPLSGAEVIIDFSHASALHRVLGIACDNHLDLVIGTTGWNDRIAHVRQLVERAGIGCVYASNFSPGANAMFALARRAGELFARFPQYAAGMEERHHAQKVDAPSGTALKIASEVREGSGGALDPPIVASRVGAEFGLHTLFFDSPDDLVEISHRARGREGFARGAIFAAERIGGRKGLVPLRRTTELRNDAMFKGVGTALITPFQSDGSLDEQAFRRFVEWQITEGVNFLVPCGTTGENPTLTAEEHRRVVELTVETANGRVPVLAGAGSNSTARAVELAGQAVDLGANGILTITPYYNKPTPDGLRRHFGAQAEAVERKKPGFPMVMYNVPSRTGP